ncbi:IMAP FAMILY MEMBER 1 putative-RELATED [Salix purpurea]|uniref:IMAP FAMILY MEMBER 1 putative-RELATED n=1 Tax=Salix purpurea TaxID=77065 RepID=A0A9Q0WHG2_SALPP|nr:IMAP FAMILY MEMBER 1 putative-RELATED [Salix purpurea]
MFQLLDPSQTPPSTSSSIDLESQLPETQAQTSLALVQEISQAPETHPPLFTAVNSEIWLQIPHTQAPQPHSSMEIELLHLPVPPTPQRPSPANNAQQINVVTVTQISLEWPNVIMAFCFEAAIQIALQYQKTQQSKLPIAFYLRSLSILLTFASLFSSQLISKKFPGISKVLEKVAIFLATFAFFATIATPLALSRS